MEKLSVSAADLFKACPRKFYYQEICGWEPAVQPSWLGKGTAYDKLLEHYDLGGLQGAVDAVPSLFKDPYDQVDAQYLLAHYHSKFGHDPLPPVEGGNQVGFGVPYHGNEITGPVEFRVTGYIDKVHQRDDELMVIERKTTSESIEDASPYWQKLPLNPQIRSYCWYLRSQGNNCGWVTYEVLRKLSSTVNKVFKHDCSLEEYIARLSKHEEKKTLVARKMIFISEDMTDDWITGHTLTFQAIQRCKEKQKEVEEAGFDGSYAWVEHAESCKSFGGCAFRDIDEGKVSFEQGPYVKSEKWLKKNGGVK